MINLYEKVLAIMTLIIVLAELSLILIWREPLTYDFIIFIFVMLNYLERRINNKSEAIT